MTARAAIIGLTPEYGVAVKMINKTGSASVKGELVEVDSGVDNAFMLEEAGGNDCIGAVYTAGVADGDECLVVVGGVAEVLIEDGTAATRGYWVRTSTSVAGRADATTATPPGLVLSHFAEIGHCLESKSSGTDVLVKIIMHFN